MGHKLLLNNVMGNDIAWEEIAHNKGVLLEPNILFDSVPNINSDISVFRIDFSGTATTVISYIYDNDVSANSNQLGIEKGVAYVTFTISSSGRLVAKSYKMSGTLISTLTLSSNISSYFAITGFKYVNKIEKLKFIGNEFPTI